MSYILRTFLGQKKKILLYVIINALFLITLTTILNTYNNSVVNYSYMYNDFLDSSLYVEVFNEKVDYRLNNDLDLKLTKIKNVVYTPYIEQSKLVEYKDNTVRYNFKATTTNFLKTQTPTDDLYTKHQYKNLKSLSLFSGRIFTQDELLKKENVILLYELQAKILFGKNDVLGQNIEIEGKNYEIIGLLNNHQDIINDYKFQLSTNDNNDSDKKDFWNITAFAPISLFSNYDINYATFTTTSPQVLSQILEGTTNFTITTKASTQTILDYFAIQLYETQYSIAIIIMILMFVVQCITVLQFQQSNRYNYYIRRVRGLSKKGLFELILSNSMILNIIIVAISFLTSLFLSFVLFLITGRNTIPFTPYIDIYLNIYIMLVFFIISTIITILFSIKTISYNISDVIRWEE